MTIAAWPASERAWTRTRAALGGGVSTGLRFSMKPHPLFFAGGSGPRLTDLDGNVVEGSLRPSSDLATHLLLYRAFPAIGGVVHTHSEFATAWAQAGREIPAYGTTHADYFYGPVPVTEELTADEVGDDYVLNTGHAIVRRFQNIDPLAIPAVLVAGHAPFSWGITPADAAHNAVVLEAVARMAYYTSTLNAACGGVGQHLLDRHYFRKHGASKTYGQEKH